MKNILSFPIIVRIGLACVFLANSLTAFLEPSEFQDLLSGSFMGGLLPVSVASFVTFIGVNDLVVALLLLSGWRLTYVGRYATAWMVGVLATVGLISLEGLEHLGFFAMALSLAMHRDTTV